MKNKVDRNERNVKRCRKCGRVVGVDYKGRKQKCSCIKMSGDNDKVGWNSGSEPVSI